MDHQKWPDPFDSGGWLDAAASGKLPACHPGAVVAALRAQIRIGHERASNALSWFVREDIKRRLRLKIGFNHPNQGETIVERAHDELMKALFDRGARRLRGARGRLLRAPGIPSPRHLAGRAPAQRAPPELPRHGRRPRRGRGQEPRRQRRVDRDRARPRPNRRSASGWRSACTPKGLQVRAGTNNIADAVGVDLQTAKA